jgi:cell division protein FtsW
MWSKALDPREDVGGIEEDVSSFGAASLLVGAVALLTCFGILTLFSIGVGANNPFHYPTRQLVFTVVGVAGAVVASKLPLRFWRVMLPGLFISTVVLLILARLVGPRINGAHRWLVFGPVSFQPSEMAKLTAVVWLAAWMSHHRRNAGEWLKGFLIPMCGLGLLCVLVLIGPDFGTTALIGATGLFVLYLAGTKSVYLMGTMLLGFLVLGVLVWHDPVRISRVTSFLEPEKYQDNESYQLINSLHAFMEGGATGRGIGHSLQKFSYLPEAHTDFIYAIIAEETGVIGSLAVLTLFGVVFGCGMVISWRSRDPFARLMGYGITLMISLQAVINIAVVTGSAPTKGLPLPFVSHGGSSIVFMLTMVGLLVRIACGDAETRRDWRSRRQRTWAG